jgi:hypothetical protein
MPLHYQKTILLKEYLTKEKSAGQPLTRADGGADGGAEAEQTQTAKQVIATMFNF